MTRPKRDDTKHKALRDSGTINPHPEKVTDELFTSNEFFDPRDLLQVKYEMLRRVRVDGQSVSQSALRFGLSRPTYYQAEKAYQEGGLPALWPGQSARCELRLGLRSEDHPDPLASTGLHT